MEQGDPVALYRALTGAVRAGGSVGIMLRNAPSTIAGVQGRELSERIRRMPKSELHLHFEGALRWSTVRELNPRAKSLASPPWAGKPFASFEEFREIFRNFLIPASGTEERIERLMFEVLEDLAVQNVRYAEPIVYPPFHMTQGLSVRQVLAAIQRATL